VASTGATRDYYETRSTERSRMIERREPVVYGSAFDGPFGDDQLRLYEQHGYLTIDRLLDPVALERCQAELRRLLTAEELRGDERVVTEPGSSAIRSIFQVHRISPVFAELVRHPLVVGAARQILGSDVYVHQSRANYKPGFEGKDFYWHSDFETWHVEDGMPTMRALSVVVALTENFPFNGPLMVMPGSHKTFVTGTGTTPENNYQSSLKDQDIGVPDHDVLTTLADRCGIDQIVGPAGSAVVFDCNTIHGSSANITPYPRSNVFLVFNSVENVLEEPIGGLARRPEFLGDRAFEPVRD
jgi:ectoine hydroxylase